MEERVKIMKRRSDALADQETHNPVSLLRSSRGNLRDSTVRLENRDKSVTLIIDEKKAAKSNKKEVKKSKINDESEEEEERRGRSKEKSVKSAKSEKSKGSGKSKKSGKSK